MTLTAQLKVIRARQPIGDLYLGSIASKMLWELAEYDMREIRKGEDGIYLATGVQAEA